MAKVTVRTLHHYDEIGLLVPSGRSPSGYRLYTQADIDRLIQIRVHRELGMPLETIRTILEDPEIDARASLQQHRRQLVRRLHQTEALLATIDRMLAQPGDETMSTERISQGLPHDPYEREAEQRWSDTPAWQESRRRTSGYGPEQWQALRAEATAILEAFAARRQQGQAPSSEAAMKVAEQHRQHIDRWFYPCSRPMHAALAEMYLADERFAATFEEHGEGLTEYVAAAIRANAAR